MNANTVTLVGNLVEDPELRYTASGVAMCKVRLAVEKSRKNKAGEWEKEASFFGGTVWRDLAEHVAESVGKGDRVVVVGSLEQRQWETKEGEKRSVVEVAIDEIGASLAYATASVSRISRSGGNGPKPASPSGFADEAPF